MFVDLMAYIGVEGGISIHSERWKAFCFERTWAPSLLPPPIPTTETYCVTNCSIMTVSMAIDVYIVHAENSWTVSARALRKHRKQEV